MRPGNRRDGQAEAAGTFTGWVHNYPRIAGSATTAAFLGCGHPGLAELLRHGLPGAAEIRRVLRPRQLVG